MEQLGGMVAEISGGVPSIQMLALRELYIGSHLVAICFARQYPLHFFV